jgi:2-polyprenyl-3-methyl-5-hydroxy-6-metoxy-1,4-benzoquinol methylase/Flp pilus assembly protein TadD
MGCFRRVLALQPDNAVAHCNLGNVQSNMGQPAEAEASYQKAIALRPDYTGAIVNLGNLYRARGELNGAEKCYRCAVALTPQSAAAHCSLGLGLWDLGRRDEAMASYQAALARDPDHVESLANLGMARWDSGALEEAEALYARAAQLRPSDPDLVNNLAALLMARGKAGAAMEMIGRSLGLRETGRAKRLFVDLARHAHWNSADAQVRAAMVRALTEPWDRPAKLSHAGAELIKLNPAIGPLVAAANASWPKRPVTPALLGDAGFSPLGKDALLIALLTTAPNTDIPLERFLTMARGAMLQAAPEGDDALRFAGALAQQCFINEYIFLADEAEMIRAQAARAALIAALQTQGAIAPIQLLTVAAYFPLFSVSGSAKLLERSWPEPVEAILTQQIREPLEERRIAMEIPRLTGIANQVSQLVQSQYEENPYPRWVRLAPGAPDNIVSFLSAKFPAARFERDPGRPMRDFLIAGCGTGQQSIMAAQKFGASHMLAVDLSLASLCYARRKSDELGLAIEYGQADILELAGLERQFDVIECVGVLHHMADPGAGWRALLALLRPNGFMKLGFYSHAARRPITEARARIAERGFGAGDIRKFRQELLESDDADIRNAILKSEDFFSVSACRDLLFHVQEQHMTLPEIAGFLKSHGLGFLGFELDDAVLGAYRERFPDDPAATDLTHWDSFEAEHPGMFAGMYEFWVWKAP